MKSIHLYRAVDMERMFKHVFVGHVKNTVILCMFFAPEPKQNLTVPVSVHAALL